MPLTINADQAPKKGRCRKCGWSPLTQQRSLDTGICRACEWEADSWDKYSRDRPSSPDYGRFRLSLIARIFVDKLTPRQVSEALAESGFNEVRSVEITGLYAMGETWSDSENG